MLRVNFVGYHARFDEAVPAGSARLAPYRTRSHRPTSVHMEAVRAPYPFSAQGVLVLGCKCVSVICLRLRADTFLAPL